MTKTAFSLLCLATAAVITAADAQTTPPPASSGPPAARPDGNPPGPRGYGTGPGMMGYGRGGAMMGGGYGGMMGGYGRALLSLDLSDAQRSQIFKIQDEARRRHWELAGRMQDEASKLRDAYFAGGKRDREAILAGYKRIQALRLQNIEISLDTADRIDTVLTPPQREQLRRRSPWWLDEE